MPDMFGQAGGALSRRVAGALRWMAGERWRAYTIVGGLAFVLRLVWVLAVDRVGFAFNDALHYHTTASSLSKGNGYNPLTGGPTARWPPGYSTLLAGVYRVFGIEPVAGEITNAVLGAVTVVVVMVVVERTIDRPTAIVAGCLLAVMPGPIMWTDVLTSETLYTLLFVVMLLVCVTAAPTWRWMLLIGFVVGIGALVRGEALTWVLLPAAVWARSAPRLALMKGAAIVLATAAVVMAPWTIRNAVVMDAFVPVATNASQTLWAGHNPSATGGQVYASDEYYAQFGDELPESELRASEAMRDDAISFMVRNPLRELELIPLKLIYLNRGDSHALDWVNDAGGTRPGPISQVGVERITVIADAMYFALLTLTVMGTVLLGRSFWRAPIGRIITVSFVTALVLYGFVYYGNYRYRLPYEPMMVIVTATLLMRLWNRRAEIASGDGYGWRR